MAYEDFDRGLLDLPDERRISGSAFFLSALAFLAVLPFALRGGPDWAFIPAVTFTVIAGLIALFHGVEYAVRRRRDPVLRSRLGERRRYA